MDDEMNLATRHRHGRAWDGPVPLTEQKRDWQAAPNWHRLSDDKREALEAPTVAALFVETDGCYFGLPGVDPWDASRDARQYAGPHPVVAHPPCDRWHQLSAVNHKRWGWAINEDGGCFAAALAAVRDWGGVLEHPAESRAFRFHGIPKPSRGSWQRTISGDWITEVDQASYGHRARKRTWLIYSGEAMPPSLDWSAAAGVMQIGRFDQKLPVMAKREALATPHAFRDLLLRMARSAIQQRAAA